VIHSLKVQNQSGTKVLSIKTITGLHEFRHVHIPQFLFVFKNHTTDRKKRYWT